MKTPGGLGGSLRAGSGGPGRGWLGPSAHDAAAGRLLFQKSGDLQQIVRQHCGADEHFETLQSLVGTTLHAPPPHKNRNATFNTRAEALPLLERGALLVGVDL